MIDCKTKALALIGFLLFFSAFQSRAQAPYQIASSTSTAAPEKPAKQRHSKKWLWAALGTVVVAGIVYAIASSNKSSGGGRAGGGY